MVRRFALRLSVLAICAWPAAAQGPASTGSSFTAADMLEINSWNVADLTRDGAWLAVTNAPRRNQLGGDFHRDTDPTYVRQSTARVWAIETATGRRVAVLPEAQTVRGATWSPDGERLALFLYRGGVFEPIIWDRRTGRSTTVKIPAGRYVAENSELRWTDDGGRLVFSLRSEAWRGEAAAHFGSLVRGPVAVQVSSEPFLSWEALRRRSTLRSVVAWDVRSGRLEDLLPTTPLTSWNLTTDGGTLTWNEDITQKTDYEATFGAETKLMARHGGGESTTVFASLKGLSISWAPDGRHYAWTREGRIYLASVDDTTSRQVAGPTGTDRPAPGDTAAVRSRASERFSVVRFSDDGSELIVSNPEGIWFLNPQSGAKEMFLATDTATTAPRYAVLAWPAKGR
ncbi:MAG: hypothetical protein SGI84_02205, partial [Gemmatimonadota bacterium]|nr:hypothetical protein [Gemmatimonadota bacterium]